MEAKNNGSQRGMALVLALIAMVLILGAVLLVSQQATRAAAQTEMLMSQMDLEEACKAGIDTGIERLWNQYVTGNGNTTGNLASYKVFVDEVVEEGGQATLASAASPIVLDEASGLAVTGLTLAREDTLFGVDVTITSTASRTKGAAAGEPATLTAQQTVRISGTPFTGFEYAVLANQINCILCHAGIRNLDQELNTDEDLRGTFDRVKVATLQALLYRKDAADSHIAGTLYTRGNVYNTNYSLLSDAQIQSSSGLKSRQFDTTNGKITQNPTNGAMITTPMVAAGNDAQGRPTQFGNLYRNYPSDPDLMTDGPLPTDFPAPFPDNDGDRYVDTDEFEEIAGVLEGSINGGVAFGVPQGSTYNTNALPTTSNSALATLAATGQFNGNLILVGTEANPIQLNGTVAVNGDLVMTGKVRGTGQIFVRGNTYLTGDVTYADAPGRFGQADDGTQNAMALITGGSVLMGDYLTVRGKNHSLDTAHVPSSAYSIDVRTANRSATQTISKKKETLNYGYFDPGVIDAGGIFPTMVDNSGKTVARQGQQFSFTQSELQLFNFYELEKAVADSSYTPRFYGMRESQPDNIWVFTKLSDEHSVKYDRTDNTVKLLQDYMISKGYPLDILDRAAYHYMNPEGNWISEDILRRIWYNDEMARPDKSKWKFDGLLYSNNAIFAITRSKARHKSYTEGKMQVRGAIICPDLGVLVAGSDTSGQESFTLLYDGRVKEFWAPQDRTQVFFARTVYSVLRDGG
ncbi:MAG: hypothetical protein GXY15_15540 [Candidatus Hydrogenedentes bacterium]|nr:hypothetical protein [Candidatus Hydrogenedentota bacterium]